MEPIAYNPRISQIIHEARLINRSDINIPVQKGPNYSGIKRPVMKPDYYSNLRGSKSKRLKLIYVQSSST